MTLYIARRNPPPSYKHIPQWRYKDLFEYHLAVGGKDKDTFGSLGYQWEDKPHRLVYNLTGMCADLRDDVNHLNAELTAANLRINELERAQFVGKA